MILSSAGLALSSEHTQHSSGLHAWVLLSLGSLQICMGRDRKRVSVQLLGSCLQSSVMLQ